MPNIDIITNYKINEGWLPIISAVFSLEIFYIFIYSKIYRCIPLYGGALYETIYIIGIAE